MYTTVDTTIYLNRYEYLNIGGTTGCIIHAQVPVVVGCRRLCYLYYPEFVDVAGIGSRVCDRSLMSWLQYDRAVKNVDTIRSSQFTAQITCSSSFLYF